jgi:hypothetical protein
VAQSWNISSFFCVGPDGESSENVIHEYVLRPAGWPREILPIADDGGGDLLALDLTDAGRGRVVLWIHDQPGNELIPVAPSLEALIDSLEDNPDYI